MVKPIFDVFTAAQYLQNNPDVKQAYINDNKGMSELEYAIQHYTTFGQKEGRSPFVKRPVAPNMTVGEQLDPSITARYNNMPGDGRQKVLNYQWGDTVNQGKRIDTSGPGNWGKYTDSDAEYLINKGLGSYITAQKAIDNADVAGLSGFKRKYVAPQYEGTGIDRYNRAVDYYTGASKPFGAEAVKDMQFGDSPWSLQWATQVGPDGSTYVVPKAWVQQGTGNSFDIDSTHVNWSEEDLRKYLPQNAQVQGNQLQQALSPYKNTSMLSRSVGPLLKSKSPLAPVQANRTMFNQPVQSPRFIPQQFNTVKDSSAWKANPTALTQQQQRGMFS